MSRCQTINQENKREGSSCKGTFRQFTLITLAHAERRVILPEHIKQRLLKIFECTAIVIAKETHEEGGFHFHIGLQANNASKNNATKVIRKAFYEFEGKQCNVKFHKGWGTVVQYITKEDKEPYVWGQYTLEEILEISEAVRRKRKNPSKATEEIIRKLKECDNWIDIYQNEQVRERLVYGSYSNLRSVFEDLQVIKQIEKSTFERIEEYLNEKKLNGINIEEYSPEEIAEKYGLLHWIACNLTCKRPIKTKQLMIYGVPSTQKTFMFDSLRKVLRIYFASARMNDFAGADDYYDLWVYDEFHQVSEEDSGPHGNTNEAANAANNTLLKVLDGQECRLDAKYSRIFNKKRNVPIILIANRIAPRAKRYGPFQERLLRIRFYTNIEELKEERIIATLRGCMLRIKNQENLINNLEQEITLQYNGEKILNVNEKQIIKKGYNKEGYMVEGTSTKKERIKIEFIRKILLYQEDGKSSTEYLDYNYAKITLDPKTIRKEEMSTLRFALIPLKKIQNGEEQSEDPQQQENKTNDETILNVFNSQRKGANFKIIRTNKENEQDYMMWPLRVFIRGKGVWSAEVQLGEVGGEELLLSASENNEKKQKEQIMTNINKKKPRKEKGIIKLKALDEYLRIGLGTVNGTQRNGCYQALTEWDHDMWSDND